MHDPTAVKAKRKGDALGVHSALSTCQGNIDESLVVLDAL